MVDTFGMLPFGRGSSGAPAPFGFAPQPPQSPGINGGQGDDAATVIPAAGRKITLWCQNRDCGGPTGGVVYPLCPECNDRLKNGGPPILLENQRWVFKPIVPGE